MKQYQRQLITEMINTLKTCQSKLDTENNSELINRINELLGRTESEFTNILDEEVLNELVVLVKENDEPISDEDMDSLLRMLGH